MGIYEGFKEVVLLAKKIDNIELYQKILDLQAETQKLAAELLEKERAIREQNQEIQNLNESLRLKAKLVRHNDCYFEIAPSGKPVGAPYCSHCFETKHVAVHVHQDPVLRQTCVCPSCKTHIQWQRRMEDI